MRQSYEDPVVVVVNEDEPAQVAVRVDKPVERVAVLLFRQGRPVELEVGSPET